MIFHGRGFPQKVPEDEERILMDKYDEIQGEYDVIV